MKNLFIIPIFILLNNTCFSQEVLKIQNGGSITIQNGAELVLQGGLALENGSSIHNDGHISLMNNSIANSSNWTDHSILGALTGNGVVIFKSTHSQQFTGPTVFYRVYINTNQLSINNDLSISNLLRLINGKINTASYIVALVNTAASALENDISNLNYANSWINGNFRRSIATNTGTYDFPVGNSSRSNLLKFINNNLAGPSFLTSSFGPKAGTDMGLNVIENGNSYTAVNNGGVWKLVPDMPVSGGSYAMQLYFNGFSGLQDNRFGILRRPDASSDAADWTIPAGSFLEPLNGSGRKVSDGFAKRSNMPDFSQFGIGEFNLATACEILGQSQVCIGSLNNIYAAPSGMTTYLWTVAGAGIAGSNTGQTVNIIAPMGGTFTINLQTTLNGVLSQCSRTISTSPNPACEISGSDNICVLSANNTYSGPANMSTYFWTASPGLQITGSNTGSSVNVTAIAPGPQLLTLHSTWLSGCVSQCSKMINVTAVVPCSISGMTNLPAGSANNVYTAPAGMGSYSWSISGNGTITGSSTSSTINITAGTAGAFTLSLTTTMNGCSRTCESTVIVDPVAVYSCTINGVQETCNGTTETFKAPAGLDSYQWNVTGNAFITGPDNDSSVNIISTSGGSYTINLQTLDNNIACVSVKMVNVNDCVTACSYTQGFYSNSKAKACYNNSGFAMSSSDHMLAAFGISGSQVFGNVANKRFFTLFRTDIGNGNIFKMLPGGGIAKAIDTDNQLPFDGAYYSDQSTWSLVPMQSNGPQKGKIRNILLSQTMVLWFNIRNSNTLGGISLLEDTLLTMQTLGCGSNIPVGAVEKFGLPHSVILYLNNGNGYPPTVEGLFKLANDVLGGVVTDISPSTVNQAVDIINNAFDECRIMVGTLPHIDQTVTGINTKTATDLAGNMERNSLKVIAYPNPFEKYVQLQILSAEKGIAIIEFFSIHGQKLHTMSKPVMAKQPAIISYAAPAGFAAVMYRVTVRDKVVAGVLTKLN